jgi:hypothetical protein
MIMLVETSYTRMSPIIPFMNYDHAVELRTNIAELCWTVDENKQEIIFEFHVKTQGWIALGISPGRSWNDSSESHVIDMIY